MAEEYSIRRQAQVGDEFATRNGKKAHITHIHMPSNTLQSFVGTVDGEVIIWNQEGKDVENSSNDLIPPSLNKEI